MKIINNNNNKLLLFIITSIISNIYIECLNVDHGQQILNSNINNSNNNDEYIQYQILSPLQLEKDNSNNNTDNYISKIKFINLNKYFNNSPYIIEINNSNNSNNSNNISIKKEYNSVYLIKFNTIPNNYYDDWCVELIISQIHSILSTSLLQPIIKTIKFKSPFIYNHDTTTTTTITTTTTTTITTLNTNNRLLRVLKSEQEKIQEISYTQNSSSLLLSINPNIYNYSNSPIKVNLDTNSIYLPWPFGQGAGNNEKFALDISVQRVPFRPITSLDFTIDSTKYIVGNISNDFSFLSNSSGAADSALDTTPPTVLTYDITLLYDQVLLIRMRITDDISGVCVVELSDGNNKYYGSIVGGDKMDGIYELWYDSKSNFTSYQYSFTIYDNVKNYRHLSLGDQYGSNSSQVIHFPNLKGFSITDIESITFLYNYIDTSNKSYFNQIYIGFKNDSVVEGSISVSFIFSYSFTSNSNLLYNNKSKLWEGSFQIPSNLQYGDVSYRIISFTGTSQSIYISSDLLDDQFQLKVYSKESDVIGPIFKNITQILPILDSQLKQYKLGWNFTIIDGVNGFKSGIISVRGDLDGSLYNFTISPDQLVMGEGDQFEGQYQILISVNSTLCLPTNYTIIFIEFTDNNLYYTIYNNNNNSSSSDKSNLNPFINFLNDPYINSIHLGCLKTLNPTIYPTILSLNISSNKVDPLKLNQEIVVQFEVFSYYGIKDYQYPSVFLQTSEFSVIRFPSIINETSNLNGYGYSHYKYNSTLVFPIGFGYPNQLSINIYNIISNVKAFIGYSSSTLAKLGYPYAINTSVISYPKDQVLLESATFSNSVLWIRGKGLKYIESISISGVSFSFIPFSEPPYESIVKVVGYEPVSSVSVQISATIANGGTLSNSIDLFIVNAVYLPPFILNNPNQECTGEPLCGGPLRGTCSPSGCICKFPSVGLDCGSDQIITDAPKVSIEQPSFQLIVNNTQSNGGSDGHGTVSTPIIVTNVSIIELREIDINGNIVNIQKFKEWYFSVDPLDSSMLYSTNITSKDGLSQTLVQVILKWFDNQEEIRYANEYYRIDPATMKMTIKLSAYKFESVLNTLELIMFNSIQSLINSTVSCSNVQFGYTTEEDCNFLKLQVDHHSLYGKFIRRTILDNHIQQVINEPINSTANQNSAESFMSIKLPHYLDYLILDPSYSVLVDYYSNDEGYVGKCFGPVITRSIGLIVGLVIGIFAFVAFIIIFLIQLINRHPSLIEIKVFLMETKNKILNLKNKKSKSSFKL